MEHIILVDNDLLVLTLADDQTRATPTELVHAPERVHWQHETPDGITVFKESVSKMSQEARGRIHTTTGKRPSIQRA